jgi:PAS domain S-box-containing protein
VLWLTGSFTLVVAAAALVGLVLVPRAERRTEDAWRGRLEAMSLDRARLVETWLAQGLANAAEISFYPTVSWAFGSAASGSPPFPREEGASAHLSALLSQSVRVHSLRAAWVVGGDGSSVSSEPRLGAEVARQAAARAREEPRAFAEILREAGERPVVAFTARVPPPADAVVVLLVSPDLGLYPMLQAEPLRTRTGECLLVRLDGDQVVFLSPLRHRSEGQEFLGVPATTVDLAATAAVSGQRAFGVFADYRGQRVLASTRRLQAAPWGLVVKVDHGEILAETRREIANQASLVALGLLSLLALGYAVARRQRTGYERALARRDAQLAALLEHANDAILVVDRSGRIRSAHGTAAALYGCSTEALQGRSLVELQAPSAAGAAGPGEIEAAFDAGQRVYETEHLGAGGEPVPVEVSARSLRLGDEELLLAIVRDVRRLRAEERRVRALNRALRTLGEAGRLVLHQRDPAVLLPELCQVAVTSGDFQMAWIGVLDERGALRVKAVAGATRPELETLVRETGDASLWWRAIREDHVSGWTSGQTENQPDCAGWMRRQGYREAIATPLRAAGRPCGVLALYATGIELGPELRPLVEDLAVDLSLVLDMAEAGRHRDAAQQALRDSEERFRRFAESALDVIYHYRLEPPGFEYVSPSFASLTGRPAGDHYADPALWLRCLHPEDRAAAEAILRGEGGRAGPVLLRVKRGDGHVVWTEHRVVQVRKGGRIVTLEAIARDVTERVHGEEALRIARERYRVALQHSPVVVFEQDHALRYTWVHDPEHHLVGEAAGHTDEERLPAADARLLRRLKQRVLETGEPLRQVVELSVGGSTTFDVTLEPRRDRDGSTSGVIGTAVDVTASREREARLRQLSRAIEEIPSSVIITDTAGTIEYVNARFTTQTGYSREEAVGQNVQMLRSGEHPPEVYSELEATVQTGREWRGELCHRRKNGEHYWESVSVAPLHAPDGQLTHFVSVYEDLTEKRAAERELNDARRQLLQSQKLEAVGRLAGGVAHDFNNLLNVIMGFTELLARDVGSHPRAQQRVDQIMKAARRAGGLTRQLLAFSRRQVLQPVVIDLNEVVADFEKMIRRLIGEDVELSVAAAAEPLPVKVDPGQMEQVLMNLCVNARDAMPRGGRLELGTARARLDHAYAASHGPVEPGDYVQLWVSDSGSGMDAKTQAHIFEPFFTTKAPGEGTGLGLSTVYGIVKQSGGYVWAYSEPGHGTTFRIYLPAVSSEAGSERPAEELAAGPVAGPDASVLLVEDQEALREMIEEILGELGYRVEAAESGSAALELAETRERPVDLLLTDLVMPRMSGRELAEKLRERWPGLRVLYMSGYTADVVTRHGILEPGVQLLQKPFSSAELARRLREALESPPQA